MMQVDAFVVPFDVDYQIVTVEPRLGGDVPSRLPQRLHGFVDDLGQIPVQPPGSNDNDMRESTSAIYAKLGQVWSRVTNRPGVSKVPLM